MKLGKITIILNAFAAGAWLFTAMFHLDPLLITPVALHFGVIAVVEYLAGW